MSLRITAVTVLASSGIWSTCVRHSTTARWRIACARFTPTGLPVGVDAGVQDAAPRFAHDEVQAHEAAAERLLALLA